MRFGRKKSNVLNRSYNEKKREGSVSKEMEKIGYDYVSEFPVGQDPGTGAIHSYVVGIGGNEDTAMVCQVVDWTQARNPGDKKRGVVLARGVYGYPSVPEAEADAKAQAERDLANYDWVQPGTDRPVVGSGRRSG